MVSGGSDGSNRIGYVAALIAGTLFILFIAFGLLFYVYQMGNVSGYQAAKKEGYSQNETTATNQAVAQCRLKPEPTLEQCIAEQIKAGRDDYRSEQDLNAQREMALWARYLLMVSLAQIPLGVAGLFALLHTIRQSREANQIASDAIFSENRESVEISGTFNFVMKNTGKSPATDIWGKVASSSTGNPGIWSALGASELSPSGYVDVPPGGEMRISEDLFFEVQTNGDRIFIDYRLLAVSVDYASRTNTKWLRTTCCWRLGNASNPSKGWTSRHLSNDDEIVSGDLAHSAQPAYYRTLT